MAKERKTSAAPPVPFEPTKLASELGALRSAWWRLGAGAWYGTVVYAAGEDQLEYEIEELKTSSSTSWRATSMETTSVSTASSLEQLLKELKPVTSR